MTPRPPWLKARLPGGAEYRQVRSVVREHNLSTVCEEARCPNLGDCWGCGTATFLILGNTCTRGCRFCAVRTDPTPPPPPDDEPSRVAFAVAKMSLNYPVITSVTRDDLPDGGASVFAETIRHIRALSTSPRVEVLTPDYVGDDLETVMTARPDVFAHNIEVTERLSPLLRHPRFAYHRSLQCLTEASRHHGAMTKSSILLGLGESRAEIHASMRHLREAGVGLLVLGQYLQPTRRNAPVERFLSPDEFNELAEEGRHLGFSHVASGPLVRTSYRAADAFHHCAP